MDTFLLDSVTCGYGDRAVLREVSLRIPDGAFAAIIGPNGCGKTTLLRAMTGIVPCTSGSVVMEGRNVARLSPREIALRVAVVAQDITVDVGFTVDEVVLMGRTPHLSLLSSEGEPDFAAVRKAMALAKVEPFTGRLVGELSVGERQRVFIAMALAQEAKTFLLDEPTTHLDIGHQMAVLNIFRKLNRDEGATVVAVLHDLNLALEYCNHAALLSDGRLVAFGAPKDVITEENVRRVYNAAALVTQNPISGRPLLVTAAE